MTKSSDKKSKNILIGISGGISAYKIASLVRIFKKRGDEVKVILTEAAKKLVGEDALKTLSQNPIYSDISDENFDMGHIRLEEWADLFILAPATANSIAKMAHGIADNLLSTTFLSLTCPIIVAPAMNTNMWNAAATVANVKTLMERKIFVLPTGVGELACGVVGAGRMLEADEIAEYAVLALENGDLYQKLAGKNVCISSGPTVEKIDEVRCITNNSSGKMGAALARAAIFAGAKTIVVSGPAKEKLPEGCEAIFVESAQEMREKMLEKFTESDIVIMAAAVSDFYAENAKEGGKISREDTGEYTLKLLKNPDIAAEIGEKKGENQKLVVFSLETDANIERAKEKMRRKNADLCVLNCAKNAIGTQKSKIVLIYKSGETCEFGEQEKILSAARILGAAG